jgi:glycosyltransferase involved in cell wall biosynthesis
VTRAPLHVLVIPSWYPTESRPGYGVFFREQARALQRAGLRMGVVFPEALPLSLAGAPPAARRPRLPWETDEGGVPTARVRFPFPDRWPRARAQAWAASCVALATAWARRHGRPDVLHAHGSCWPFAAGAVAARQAARRLGIPYVVTEHSTRFLEGRPFDAAEDREIRRGLDGAARILAVGGALARAVEPFAPPGRLAVLGNLVDGAFFRPPDAPPARPTILCVAGLVPRKGVAGLLRAYGKAFPGDDAPVLEVAGDGPERSALEAEARHLGLAGRVRFLGPLDRDGVREALWRAGLFALNSRIETFGIVLAEALAAGVPVVSTRCGGAEDVVDPRDGLLVPADDDDALAAALGRAWATRGERDPGDLRRRALERFGEAAICGRLAAIYDEARAGSTRDRK